MSLSIGQALGRGTRRSLSVSGLVLFVAMVVYQVVLVGTVNTVVVNSLPPNISPEEIGAVGFTFPISTGVAGVVGVASLLFGTGVFFIATRLLSRELSALGSIPPSLLGHRFGRAFLSTLAVSLVLAVVIPIGLALLFVPGLFLAVSFQFAVFAVGVEDCGPLAGLRRSWELASGNRWRLFGLLLVVTGVTVVASRDATVGNGVNSVGAPPCVGAFCFCIRQPAAARAGTATSMRGVAFAIFRVGWAEAEGGEGGLDGPVDVRESFQMWFTMFPECCILWLRRETPTRQRAPAYRPDR